MEAYYNNIAYLAQLYTLLKTHYEHVAAGKIEPAETQQVKEAIDALTPLQTNLLQALNQITPPRKLLIYFPASAGSAESRSRGQIPSAENALEFTRRLQFFGVTPEVYFVDPNFANPSPLDAVEITRPASISLDSWIINSGPNMGISLKNMLDRLLGFIFPSAP